MTGGTKTKIYCQASRRRACILVVLRTIKVGLIKVGNQTKPLKYSEKKIVFLKNLEHSQTYGHRPQYKADNDAAEMAVRAQKKARLLLPQRYGQ